MELLVWGFVTTYIQNVAQGPLANVIVFLISGAIFWDILYRSQQGVTISFIEDIWTQNIANLLISPLRIWEWLTATFCYGMVKTSIIAGIMSVIAYFLYNFHLLDLLGLYLIPMIFNLLFFGWALGVFTSALLIRWGHSVEALIWGVPFLVQPISAIYYPLETLPPAVQVVSKFLPSTYVFEGMREIIASGRMPMENILMSFLLNIVFFVMAGLFFMSMYHQSRKKGKLGKLGQD